MPATIESPTRSVPCWTSTVATAPRVKGRAVAGHTLGAVRPTWTVKPSAVRYQWLRNGKAVKGATKASYKVKGADAGKKLKVVVTGTSAGHPSATATSRAIKVKKP